MLSRQSFLRAVPIAAPGNNEVAGGFWGTAHEYVDSEYRRLLGLDEPAKSRSSPKKEIFGHVARRGCKRLLRAT